MLLLTDRPNHAIKLKQTVEDVEPCVVSVVGCGRTDAADHAIIICDVDLERPASFAETKTVLARHRFYQSIPLLHLARDNGPAALARSKDIGATVVLPPNAPTAQILFTVRRLVEARRSGKCEPVPPAASVISANIRAAALVYTEILEALRNGEPISIESLERGSQAVMAAVGGGRLSAWLDVVQAYDDITYQHCLLVAGFASTFSTHLGLTIGNQRLVCKAALLHDIGKLRIPREILDKPGRLTPEEMKVVRTHPKVGHDMLVREGGFDPQTLDMVLHHHEFLDGSGYPHGLRGDRIVALVRMMTICDIYAALVERRSYKEPMPSDVALAILHDMGSKLDRHLVDAFEAMIGGHRGSAR